MTSIERLTSVLRYDAEAGTLIWTQTLSNRSPAGSRVRGRCVGLDGVHYSSHAIAWAMATGQWPDREVERVGGTDDDFRLCNLRLRPKATKSLSVEQLREFLAYDPATGVLTWKKVLSRRAVVGAEAGAVGGKGYVYVGINGLRLRGHVVAWAHYYGYWPTNGIDHIDGDKLNNRISNLRLATNSQNHANKPLQKNNTSGYKGVRHNKKRDNWSAFVKANGRNQYLGSFGTAQEAAAAYDAAAIAAFGNFALTNHQLGLI